MKKGTIRNMLVVPENQKVKLVRNKSGIQSSASTDTCQKVKHNKKGKTAFYFKDNFMKNIFLKKVKSGQICWRGGKRGHSPSLLHPVFCSRLCERGTTVLLQRSHSSTAASPSPESDFQKNL